MTELADAPDLGSVNTVESLNYLDSGQANKNLKPI